jgi:hypothetical protein
MTLAVLGRESLPELTKLVTNAFGSVRGGYSVPEGGTSSCVSEGRTGSVGGDSCVPVGGPAAGGAATASGAEEGASAALGGAWAADGRAEHAVAGSVGPLSREQVGPTACLRYQSVSSVL